MFTINLSCRWPSCGHWSSSKYLCHICLHTCRWMCQQLGKCKVPHVVHFCIAALLHRCARSCPVQAPCPAQQHPHSYAHGAKGVVLTTERALRSIGSTANAAPKRGNTWQVPSCRGERHGYPHPGRWFQGYPTLEWAVYGKRILLWLVGTELPQMSCLPASCMS